MKAMSDPAYQTKIYMRNMGRPGFGAGWKAKNEHQGMKVSGKAES